MDFGIGPFVCQVPPDGPRTYEQEYETFLQVVSAADDAGFRQAWTSEHHFTRDGTMNSPLEVASAALAVTDDIRLGTAIATAPLYNPIRLAEATATIGIIGDGRFDLGLGIGYRDEEFERFDADKRMRVRRLKETVHFLRRAWRGEPFDFDGMAIEVEDVLVQPAPATPPNIFVGGFAMNAVERSARIGDGHILGPKNFDDILPRRNHIDEVLAEENRPPEEFQNVVMADMFVARENAWEKFEDGFRYFMQRFADWNFGGELSDEQFEKAKAQAVYGTPEEVAAELEEYRETLGEDIQVMGKFMYPGMDGDVVRESVELFGDEVIPEF